MLHVETLHVSSAAASAAYYTRYLTEAPGEGPGVWSGRQAAGFGLTGEVSGEQLEMLLRGRDPVSGATLGSVLKDRINKDGKVIEAVSGFDATFSAPKTVSLWWGLTQDDRLLQAHDAAVTATLAHLERFGSTTRIRVDGHRRHPDTQGLTIALFRQTTSRDDDPQLHTHVVISSKVQTTDGHWYALDGRYLKLKQRMLGGMYQSLLRSELTARFGVDWHPIVKGQAEIVGPPRDLLRAFSKRSVVIAAALKVKVDEFRQREGRDPSRFERAAIGREAAKDTRPKKSGNGVPGLVTLWREEAEAVGWTPEQLTDAITTVGRQQADQPLTRLTVEEIVEGLGVTASTWCRPDVMRAICDVQRPIADMLAGRWLDVLERAADRVVERCVDLDPAGTSTRRDSDGRSEWIEPTAPGLTSEAVLAEEEAIVAWAIHAQLDDPHPSTSVDVVGLDGFQADAAAAVAGHDPLVLAAGAAGTGKTNTLTAARDDLEAHGRPVFGLAPTAKAARGLQDKTGIVSDTVAKLLHELAKAEPDSRYRLPAGTTVVVDEAGMLNTAHLRHLVHLVERHAWRLVLIGDPLQLQAVGRGGLFDELLRHGRVYPLEHIHRFTHLWEAQASLQIRSGDPQALDAYQAHDRIIPGTLEEQLDQIATAWVGRHRNGDRVAVVASTNDHVDLLNATIQELRITNGDLDPDTAVLIGGGERAHVGDVVATRRNDRRLLTTQGEPVRNRELWIVTATHPDGSLTVTHHDGYGHITLPEEYVAEHVRLGYAATEYGYQSDTVTAGHSLAGPATTRRGLYVAVTRGRDDTQIHVITQSHDLAEARDVLERTLAVDQADIPAVTQRQRLAQQDHPDTTPSSPQPRTRQGRCEIPVWFDQLRDDTRNELANLQERVADSAAERARIQVDLDAARLDVERLDRPTRQERDQLAAARHDLDDAERQHRLAVQRVDTSGIRGRRQARRDLAAAENRVTWANNTLDRLEAQASPYVDRYHQARNQLYDLGDELQHQYSRELLDRWTTTDRIPELHERLEALDTWWRFATGDTIDVDRLGPVVDALHYVTGDNAGRCQWLADTVEQYCDHAGLHLPTTLQPETPGIESPGLDISL
jgi:conjugative relaxase-like TrwC/TraI family protein